MNSKWYSPVEIQLKKQELLKKYNRKIDYVYQFKQEENERNKNAIIMKSIRLCTQVLNKIIILRKQYKDKGIKEIEYKKGLFRFKTLDDDNKYITIKFRDVKEVV